MAKTLTIKVGKKHLSTIVQLKSGDIEHDTVPNLVSGVNRWAEDGLDEWVGERDDVMPRHTESSDPLFLERLRDYLARQFPDFSFELDEDDLCDYPGELPAPTPAFWLAAFAHTAAPFVIAGITAPLWLPAYLWTKVVGAFKPKPVYRGTIRPTTPIVETDPDGYQRDEGFIRDAVAVLEKRRADEEQAEAFLKAMDKKLGEKS